ncbi:MAG: tRNA (5-methylaminomethyl-2-thiouridine)(34)-methyltransferase MnmD [Bacteroidetes bacterium]|nr:tRNA (5-methylaminomethyl-2-thiouridine)(34)-methyltransferase MnmD [Bacteroidota bacterium]
MEIVLTEDGSNSIFSSGFNEHYHSTHGAIQESKHIFIEAGLKSTIIDKPEIHILEIGFGTGLNANLTKIELESKNVIVNYTSYEAFPVPEKIFSALNYSEQLKQNNDFFIALHQANWNEWIEILPKFKLLKLHQKIEDAELPNNHFDFVYFDAFSPEIQAELWSEAIFLKIFQSMKNNAVLTTYSAKGIVKRALKSAGFVVENLPGPPGKREITRAKKIEYLPNNL